MGLKAENLKRLLDDNLNVFEYTEIKNIEDLTEYIKNNKYFTIRFDRDKNIQGLPFYIYDESMNIEKLINEANEMNCTLLCSNGYIHDNDLLFNFVIDIDSDNNFILELCDKKVPLREMYKCKTTIIKGNIFESKYTYINKEENTYSIKDIDKIVDLILGKNMKYKYMEGTIYNKKVGLLNTNIIIWQTD